jgi:hypothetical protein
MTSELVHEDPEPREIQPQFGYEVERVLPDRPPPPPPLTPDEVRALLDLVVAYTGRQPDVSMVQVWGTQAVLGRWTLAEATTAIHRWGRDRRPNDFLQPSDVTHTIRAERQDAALRAENERLRNLPPLTPDRLKTIREFAGSAFRSWVSLDDDTTVHPRGLHVPCEGDDASSGCGAQRGEGCRMPRGVRRRPRDGFVHASRMDRERAFVAENRRTSGIASDSPGV